MFDLKSLSSIGPLALWVASAQMITAPALADTFSGSISSSHKVTNSSYSIDSDYDTAAVAGTAPTSCPPGASPISVFVSPSWYDICRMTVDSVTYDFQGWMIINNDLGDGHHQGAEILTEAPGFGTRTTIAFIRSVGPYSVTDWVYESECSASSFSQCTVEEVLVPGSGQVCYGPPFNICFPYTGQALIIREFSTFGSSSLEWIEVDRVCEIEDGGC